MPDQLNWGILGTGSIAGTFARGLAQSRTGNLFAVGSRNAESAGKFGEKFDVPRRHGSYNALLADPDVHAVYIGTPHPQHAEWAIKSAQAGKHVLVEKPLALNHAEAMAIYEAAAEHDVLAMEAFMYRCHPQTAKLIELIADGAIGAVRVIDATFSFHATFNPEGRLFKNDLAGGGIMDVGCYPVSIARLIAGAATGKRFADPTHVTGTGHIGQTGVDQWAVASLKFAGPGGAAIIAALSAGVSVNRENVVRIDGDQGRIILNNPWASAGTELREGVIVLHRNGQPAQEITIPVDRSSYAYEADVFGEAVLTGRREPAAPAMSRDDSLGNSRTLDRWREAVGVTYEIETPAKFPRTTVGGAALARRGDVAMQYATIPGLELPISRLILGCDNQQTFPHAAVMFDHFFEHGGNAFDTAYIYGNGRQEKLVGAWVKHRNVRDQIALVVKGAHTPECDPVSLHKQFNASLERLQTDYADLYVMHRDNPAVPVGEFITAMNDLVSSGRCRAFGGSNWSLARVAEANAYAAAHGLQPMRVVSNNFSLARMIDPIWTGCVTASDDASRAWFTKHQLTLLAWSSQARGFFLPGRATPEKRDDAELVRCWYSADNFKRLERAKALAARHHVTPINIALAYVLNQPFPTIALIGPRELSETRTSLPGLGVKLSAEEMTYLNSESG